ncbi:MAG: T9SS type A sorting domain-containing protein [Bacteroidota bacterium]
MKIRILLMIVMLCLIGLIGRGQIITTIAGTGIAGYNGDNILATTAKLNGPGGIAIDKFGNVFIPDGLNNRIRKIDHTTGFISTVAGIGTAGYSGDSGLATLAELHDPTGVAVDDSGNIFIADENNNVIRKVFASTGKIFTYAGTGNGTFGGENGPAISADLSVPSNVCLDKMGNLFICDFGNFRIRKVDKTTGIINTVAGNGTSNFNGDGILATNAELNFPYGVSVDTLGNIFIADNNNYRVRKLDVTTGLISTVAGNGMAGFFGDNGQATSAKLMEPIGICLDMHRNIFIADYDNCRIRKVDFTTGIINTIAGNGTCGFFGDLGLATAAEINKPISIAVDSTGDIFISDLANNRIRKIVHSSGIPNIDGNYYGISIYPNPTTTILNIHHSTCTTQETLLITDLMGNVVYKAELHGIDNSISISTWSAGIYFYEVRGQEGSAIGKFVKE